jgi:hypothetical protein
MDAFECNSVIEATQGCVINLTFNAAQQAIESDYNASIALTDAITIPANIPSYLTGQQKGRILCLNTPQIYVAS